jgi:hypothetical protein
MIIFYNKKSGKIAGTISGRIHSEAQLKMWVGDRDENDRIVVQWVKTGNETVSYEPKTDQPEIFNEIDVSPKTLKKYIVDVGSGKLIKK